MDAEASCSGMPCTAENDARIPVLTAGDSATRTWQVTYGQAQGRRSRRGPDSSRSAKAPTSGHS
jgi:hypothetical protein